MNAYDAVTSYLPSLKMVPAVRVEIFWLMWMPDVLVLKITH